MGRHAAADGAAVHPVVAAALARRAEGMPSGRHGDLRAEGTRSNVGWPARTDEGPSTGGSTGWPGGMTDPAPQRPPAAPARPRGWRRLFGSRAA
ncbi:hypothetical protein ACI79C_00770 [Geodermatophilus sp. SYSU D00697]